MWKTILKIALNVGVSSGTSTIVKSIVESVIDTANISTAQKVCIGIAEFGIASAVADVATESIYKTAQEVTEFAGDVTKSLNSGKDNTNA